MLFSLLVGARQITHGVKNMLNTLGLCKKAGKLIAGFDAVIAEMARSANNVSNVSGIVTASDLSEKSRKEIKFHCGKHGKPVIEINATMNEIESVLGKKTGIIAILDDGLWGALCAQGSGL
jgi:ribosomal protein L30E